MDNLIIKKVDKRERKLIKQLVKIHIETFKGFFLTFMGKGFLYSMYKSYCQHSESCLYAVMDGDNPCGFLASSGNMSGLYKFMIIRKLIPFAFYSLGAFIRKPKVFMRLIRAFLKPNESQRKESYMELSSIGVKPEYKGKGIGSMLISELKKDTDFNKYKYISLETDMENNDIANKFYLKNGFKLVRNYSTHEGRKMNEYHFGDSGENN